MREITKKFIKELIVLALTKLSQRVLQKYNPKIIAVTGSVGKTTTKDAIFTAISPNKITRKSEKSFNSEIGIPLTILGCKNAWDNPFLWLQNLFTGLMLVVRKNEYPEWLVLEVGADRPGDIKKVSSWLHPDIAVITTLPKVPVHVEYFASPQDVSQEKLYLAKALKINGTLILNADDEDLIKLTKDIEVKKITYGLKNDADIQAGDVLMEFEKINETEKATGIFFELKFKEQVSPVSIKGTLGESTALACACAVAVGLEVGASYESLVKNISKFKGPQGRMNLISGIKNSLIIDDSYNSSPSALFSALETLKKIKVSKKGRKISVLGDMLELGNFSIEEHKHLGKTAGKISDILITVGLRARGFVVGALDGGMSEKDIFQYESSQMAGAEFQNEIKEGDIILVKGSQGIRMEKFIEEIMESPENKGDLLVRQDKEWERR